MISVNDYLTARDAEQTGPLYRALGLDVGCVIQGMQPQERRIAYSRSITYVTNKEIVFDYLRDRLTLGARTAPLRTQAEQLYSRGERMQKLLLRGLHFALVDEADSILIDEARTPPDHLGANRRRRGGGVSPSGPDRCRGIGGGNLLPDRPRPASGPSDSPWTRDHPRPGRSASARSGRGWVWREGMISQALSALHLFHPRRAVSGPRRQD